MTLRRLHVISREFLSVSLLLLFFHSFYEGYIFPSRTRKRFPKYRSEFLKVFCNFLIWNFWILSFLCPFCFLLLFLEQKLKIKKAQIIYFPLTSIIRHMTFISIVTISLEIKIHMWFGLAYFVCCCLFLHLKYLTNYIINVQAIWVKCMKVYTKFCQIKRVQRVLLLVIVMSKHSYVQKLKWGSIVVC
jgi:hypothetical protein